MACHDIHTQKIAGADHVLATGPECCTGTLPSVTTVEKNAVAVATFGTQSLDQCCQVGEPPNLAVFFCGIVEVQVGERMGFDAVGSNIVVFQEILADDMGRLALCCADTQIDAGFAEIDGIQLCMAVCHVHEADIAEFGHFVQIRRFFCCRKCRCGEHASGAGKAHQPYKFSS